MKKHRTMDLTKGTIWKQLLAFALPLLGASLIQMLYNAVDLWCAGNFIGKQATAAVGACSLVISCLVGFFSGLSVGTGVAVSQSVGLKNTEKTNKIIQNAFALSLIGGTLLMGIGIIGAPRFLLWMDVPEEIYGEALSYVRIYFVSMISMLSYNMLSGVLRSLGDSRTPMLIQIVGGLTNLAADLAAIHLFHAGTDGIAWATTLSQSVAALLCVLYLCRKNDFGKLEPVRIRLDRNIAAEILRVGLPAGLQTMVIALSNVFVQYKVNDLGIDAIAAFAVYIKVELFIYLPIVAFGQAIMVFAGQNTGAKNVSRVREGVRACVCMGVAYVIMSSTLLLMFGKYAFGFFNSDPGVISCGIRFIRVTFPFYSLYVILEVLADAVRGAGKSAPPMAIILVNICAVRTILLFAFTAVQNEIEAIAATYPTAWFLAALCLVIYWRSNRWTPAGMQPADCKTERMTA